MRSSRFLLLSGGYDSDAEALFARMTTQPSAARKELISRTIGSLKSSGVWQKLDALYVLAAHDAQAARLNWVASQFTLTANNNPTFTIDRGYAGNGSSSYLSTGFNAATAGGQYVRDSAHLGVWSLTDASTDGHRDAGNSTSFIVSRGATGGFAVARINQASANNITVANALGHTVSVRRGAALREDYRDGSSVFTGTTASTAVVSESMEICRAGGTGYSTRQIAVNHFGSQLSAGQVQAFYAAISAYLSSIGAV